MDMAKAKRKAAKKKAVKKKTAKKAVKKVKKQVKAKAKSVKAKTRSVKAKKSSVYIKISKSVLGEAPQECEFYLQDGKKLKSVYELIDALEHMSEDIFKQHVNEAKNDFSNWIKDVFEEPHVAKEIKKVQDKIEMQKVLMKKLIEAARRS